MIDGTKRTCMQFKDVRSFLDSILSEDTHAKRVDSLANATLGVIRFPHRGSGQGNLAESGYEID